MGFLRDEKVKELKARLKSQQNIFMKLKTTNENAIKVSLEITQLIIKKSKPFSGEFIKDCMLKTCDIMFQTKSIQYQT